MSDICGPVQSWPIFTMEIRFEQDVVQARQRARQIASHLHYDLQELTRIATAVSELVRYAYKNGGFNQVTFALVGKKFRVSVSGQLPKPGEFNVKWSDQSLSNDAKSLGLIGARKLMDEFNVKTNEHGIELSLTKTLPLTFPIVTRATLDELSRNLEDARLQDPYDEIKQQNRELMFALNALKNQQMELEQLNKELAETNQGVLALYAELEDKALSLQKASEAKSLFFSNMTHEFRTPLNSATSLVRMLLDRQDGDLTREQERQVVYIRKAIEDLSQMVNDLLDTAKLESGKINLRLTRFEVADLFSALRGMFRPLVGDHPNVNLVFDDVSHLPPMVSDESKVAQILRNFISNALKNTELGEIHVSAKQLGDRHLVLSVTDTGIGIAQDDQERIFEEFVQIDTARYPVHHGTGLGLPLSKRLALLLGGRIMVESVLDHGSTFSLMLPLSLHEEGPNIRKHEKTSDCPPILSREGMSEAYQSSSLHQRQWMMIDHCEVLGYLLADVLRTDGIQLLECKKGLEAFELARHTLPHGILIGETRDQVASIEILERLKMDVSTRCIPAIMIIPQDFPEELRRRVQSLAASIIERESGMTNSNLMIEIRNAMRGLERPLARSNEVS